MTVLNLLINCLIFITLIFSVAFVVVYGTSSWKMNNLGRATMTWGIAMVIWCSTGLVYSFIGPTWYYPWLRLVAYMATSWAMGSMLYALITTKREFRHDHRTLLEQDNPYVP